MVSINSYNEKHKGKSKVKIEFIPRGNGYDYENKLNTAISFNICSLLNGII